ncbi:MAG: hypothetical protein UZ07_CHB004001980, partial [Chlorobi bacterium OLB7]
LLSRPSWVPVCEEEEEASKGQQLEPSKG